MLHPARAPDRWPKDRKHLDPQKSNQFGPNSLQKLCFGKFEPLYFKMLYKQSGTDRAIR